MTHSKQINVIPLIWDKQQGINHFGFNEIDFCK